MTIDPFQFLRESKSIFLGEKHSVSLNGRKVPYILKRCRRKTIGMRINADGLFVSTPLKESLRWIELVLQDKACWILKKLDEWEKNNQVNCYGKRRQLSLTSGTLEAVNSRTRKNEND